MLDYADKGAVARAINELVLERSRGVHGVTADGDRLQSHHWPVYRLLSLVHVPLQHEQPARDRTAGFAMRSKMRSSTKKPCAR